MRILQFQRKLDFATFSFLSGADRGSRTPMKLPSHGPEPCASANSAISA